MKWYHEALIYAALVVGLAVFVYIAHGGFDPFLHTAIIILAVGELTINYWLNNRK